MTEEEIKQAFAVKPRRTGRQNKAAHLAFTLLANQLNDMGLDVKKVIKVNIPWTPQNVKEYLFRPVMKAMLAKDSTTELDTKQISDVWDVLMRELGEKMEVEYIPFPSEERTESYLKSFEQSDGLRSLNKHLQ